MLLGTVLCNAVMAKHKNQISIYGVIKEKISGEGIPGVVLTVKKITESKDDHVHESSLFFRNRWNICFSRFRRRKLPFDSRSVWLCNERKKHRT